MAARDELINYGYVLDADGKYRRPGKRTQVWQELENGKGWLRFDPDASGQEMPVPLQVSAAYQGTSGLHPVHHAGSFDWVWPEEEVEKIYGEAVKAAAERLHAARERKGQLADAITAAAAPPLTAEQLASMQNAQAGQAAAAKGTAEEPKKKKSWWG